MNKADYTICKANQSQRNYVLERYVISDERERENAIIYVSVDSNGKILGRIIIKERDIPAPILGKRWYICKIFVDAGSRRKGIATALVDEIKRQAESSGIVYLEGSANPTAEASSFWLNQGFTMHAYGKKQEDKSKPLFYGNYHHVISYRIRRKLLLDSNRRVRIRSITKDEIAYFAAKYAAEDSQKAFFIEKADELFGFAALDEAGSANGIILGFADSMQAPLTDTLWWVSIFVETKCRNMGIGRALVREIYQYAKYSNVIQLTSVDKTEENIGFWYELGFDVYFWGESSQTGKRSTMAMVRVK